MNMYEKKAGFSGRTQVSPASRTSGFAALIIGSVALTSGLAISETPTQTSEPTRTYTRTVISSTGERTTTPVSPTTTTYGQSYQAPSTTRTYTPSSSSSITPSTGQVYSTTGVASSSYKPETSPYVSPARFNSESASAVTTTSRTYTRQPASSTPYIAPSSYTPVTTSTTGQRSELSPTSLSSTGYKSSTYSGASHSGIISSVPSSYAAPSYSATPYSAPVSTVSTASSDTIARSYVSHLPATTRYPSTTTVAQPTTIRITSASYSDQTSGQPYTGPKIRPYTPVSSALSSSIPQSASVITTTPAVSQPISQASASVSAVYPDPQAPVISTRSAPVSIRKEAALQPMTNELAAEKIKEVLSASGVPDGKMTLQILWTTLSVIDKATKDGNFSDFMTIVSPRLKSELKPENLPKQFASLNTDHIRVGNAVGAQPSFDFLPHIIEDGRLRMRGAFNVQPSSIKFDLLYAKSNGIWYLDAIAFAEGGSA